MEALGLFRVNPTYADGGPETRNQTAEQKETGTVFLGLEITGKKPTSGRLRSVPHQDSNRFRSE